MAVPYPELIAGTEDVVSTLAYVSSPEDIPAYTPLMLDATSGILVPWDGVNPGAAVYLTAFIINPATQPRVQVYKGGIFNIDIVNWPGSVTTTQAKMAAFVGSGISVQALGA